MSYFKNRESISNSLPSHLNPKALHPKNALVEVTNGCNHSCIFCKNSNQKRRVTTLTIDSYESFISQATKLGLEEVGLYATGEPFMTKNLEEYISIAKKHGVKRVYLTSNGALASLERVIACHQAGLDSIKFSINAVNRESYNLVHGSDDFDNVIFNLNKIKNWIDTSGANLQLLCSCVMIPAFGDISEIHKSLFGKYFEETLYQFSDSQGGQAYDLTDDIGVSPHGIFSNYGIEKLSASLKPCPMVWNRYHLTAEGYLTACCVDYELDLVFSTLANETLEQAWNNQLAQKLRLAHIDGDLEGLLCNQCLRNIKLPFKPIMVIESKLKTNAIRMDETRKLKNRIIQISEIK